MTGSIHSIVRTVGRVTAAAARARTASTRARSDATTRVASAARPIAAPVRSMSVKMSRSLSGRRLTIVTSRFASRATADRTSVSETAQTSQRSCVTTVSGEIFSRSAVSMSYTASACRTTSRTDRSMARLDGDGALFAFVNTGRPTTSWGQSHSCETPARSSRAPSAQTISVADGRRETIRGMLLDDGFRDLLRFDHLGKIFLGINLKELRALRDGELGIARLDPDATAVHFGFLRPGDLALFREQPVDEDADRVGMRRLVDEPERAARGVLRVHFREVHQLQVLAEALALEL